MTATNKLLVKLNTQEGNPDNTSKKMKKQGLRNDFFRSNKKVFRKRFSNVLKDYYLLLRRVAQHLVFSKALEKNISLERQFCSEDILLLNYRML